MPTDPPASRLLTPRPSAPRALGTRDLSRRRFLLGAGTIGMLGASGLVSACGGGDGGDAIGSSSTDGPPDGSELSIFTFFDGESLAAGGPVRAPFSLGDADGPLTDELAPDEIEVTVLDPDGEQVGEVQRIQKHVAGLPRPYYPLRFTAPAAGFYDLQIDTGDQRVEGQMQVNEASKVRAVKAGDRMPAVATPTAAAPLGVDPICTREPACPLHERSFAEVVAKGPAVLMVSTPAFCQVAVCGPTLDLLLDLVPDHPGVAFVHAEVYLHPGKDLTEFSPVIADLGLTFEPACYVVGADGVVVERLDSIFDRAEMGLALDRL